MKWKSQKESYQEALYYMKGRMEGTISSFKTPWDKMNDATTNGLEWGSMTVIGGRPGTGKTLIKDQLIREGVKLNCSQHQFETAEFPFRVLEFQLEMIGRVSAIREFSSVLQRPYKYICSADDKLTPSDLLKCRDYAKRRITYPVDIVDVPCTVQEFKDIIIEYMNFHKKSVWKNTIVTLDHSLLLKRNEKHEKDKMDMLYNLGEAITSLKRVYPIAFVILSQLNRGVDTAERNEDGSYGNYILESDIFGADALLQHADTLVGLNRPGQRKIRIYGPDRYIIDNDNIMAWHFLKCRNGDTRISFFRAEYDKMRVVEIDPPPRQKR